jgi:metal-responsive CopG/Arc/MetJ family transcriptional regulator
MKTAVSIPDKLFSEADNLAKSMGISRSELYQKAIDQFLHDNRFTGVTEKLNALYSGLESKLDDEVSEMQFHTINSEDW